MNLKKEPIKDFSVLLIEGKFREAERVLKKRLKALREEQSRLYVLLGRLCDQLALGTKSKPRRVSLQKEAKGYFEKALSDRDIRWQAMRGLATLLMHQRKYTESLKLYRKTFQFKKSLQSYNDLGNIYQKLGKNKLAFKYYKKALSFKKERESLPAPLYNLVRLSRKMGLKSAEGRYLRELSSLSKKSLLAKKLLKRLEKLRVAAKDYPQFF